MNKQQLIEKALSREFLTAEQGQFMFENIVTSDLMWGYFILTLPVLFVIKGAKDSDISGLTFIAYPTVFKLFIAPIIDTYFIPCIGKRKTWLIIPIIINGLFIFYFSFSINNWFENNNYSYIIIFGIIFCTLIQFMICS